jgi:hypothetical protein
MHVVAFYFIMSLNMPFFVIVKITNIQKLLYHNIFVSTLWVSL